MIKRELKMKLFKTIEELQQALSTAVKKLCTQPAIKQLTAYSYYQMALLHEYMNNFRGHQ